jgi:5-methyltetrahydrofolate--homocysteine methyltransferase
MINNISADKLEQTLKRLHQAISEKILVIDGAMGTMLQRYKLGEKEYRGTRFADFHRDLK